jgi:hypothetical protein
VNATRNLKKATDWSDIKKYNLLTETQLSWYHSIDKKHLRTHVKFDGGLSIPVARKSESKKNGTFLREWWVCPFFQMAGCEMFLKFGTFLKM